MSLRGRLRGLIRGKQVAVILCLWLGSWGTRECHRKECGGEMAAAWVWHLNGFDLAAYGRDFFARACSAVVELAKQTRFF